MNHTTSDSDAWLIAIADILDATATVLDQLEPATRDHITRILHREIPGYNDCDDLAHRAHAAVHHLDHNN